MSKRYPTTALFFDKVLVLTHFYSFTRFLTDDGAFGRVLFMGEYFEG